MLKSSSNSSYSEVVKQEQKKKRNTQGIFDRQIELCEFFAVMNAHLDVNYKVNNDCILIRVCYDKNSQWNANQGKRTLWKLVEKYKLDLIGYERQGIRFTKVNAPWCKKKIICDYSIPLNLLKFGLHVFLFSQDYQNYSKGYFNKFNLF